MPRAGIAVFLGFSARPAGDSQVEMRRVGSAPAPSPFVRRTKDTGKRSKKGGWRTMATATFKSEAGELLPFPERIVAMNSAPPGFDTETDSPPGFLPFLMPLHEALTPRQAEAHPDLRPVPHGVGQRTLAGTRAAVRTMIRYRNGALNGHGASLLDGYMEDLATDRIYRLMIAQRMRHNGNVADDTGEVVVHTPELISKIFDEELEKLLANPGRDLGSPDTFREARRISEAMIKAEEFDPV